MCLMCEEQELYDLYLEQLERARKATLGETPAPNANWMWPSVAQPAEPVSTSKEAPGADKPAFICDTPGE